MVHDNDTEKQGASLMGAPQLQEIITDLGLQDDSPEVQAEIVEMIGKLIFKEMTLEILEALPESERAALDEHMGSGDMRSLRAFLEQHIPDVDAFLGNAAQRAYASVKERAARMQEREE
jgi:hypothetical protein